MNSTDSILAKDLHARAAALDISKSYCVQAPAGSGKTELLTQRLLKLLASCQRPEEILAITFTRKAAAEMRRRLLNSLKNAVQINDSEFSQLEPHQQLTYNLAREVLQQNSEQNWNLLENPQRLFITTIDGFNNFLTSSLPLISGFGSQPAISEDSDTLFDEAVKMSLELLDKDDPLGDQLIILLEHFNNNMSSLQTVLINMLQTRDQWIGPVMSHRSDPDYARRVLSKNLTLCIEQMLSDAAKILKPWESEICTLLQFAARNLAELKDNTTLLDLGFSNKFPPGKAGNARQWAALANFFLSSSGDFLQKPDVRRGFPAKSNAKDKEQGIYFDDRKKCFSAVVSEFQSLAEVHPLLVLLTNLPSNEYSDEQWKTLSALTAFLPTLVGCLNIISQQRGVVDHTQVALNALDSLGDTDNATDLALRLDYRIRHILVDEFQDTSQMQIHLLEKLTEGWQPCDGRSLFIVGDGMQSCYGFRNADVGLFLKARDQGIGSVELDALQLTRNFRSEKAIIEWVNKIFKLAFPAKDDIGRGAVSYSSSVSLLEDYDDAGVHTRLFQYEDKQLMQARNAEATDICSKIQEISNSSPDASIAILARNRSHLQYLIPALRKQGIKWNAGAIDPLDSYPQIKDLLSLAEALLNLSDTTAMFALLRSPIIGLQFSDLHQLTQYSDQYAFSLWHVLTEHLENIELGKDAFKQLKRSVPVLRMARDMRQQMPLSIWLEHTWVALGGPALLDEEFDLTIIEAFFQLLDKEAVNWDILNIDYLREKVSSQYANPVASADTQLQIMTMHNAKGLEFDYVFLPSLDRITGSSSNPLLYLREYTWQDKDELLLMGLSGKRGDKDQDPTYQYLKYEARLREEMESTRLLYIAVTRAAKQCFLSGIVKAGRSKPEKPAANSLLTRIWNPLLEQNLNIEFVDAVTIEDSQNNTPEVHVNQHHLQRLAADFVHPFKDKLSILNDSTFDIDTETEDEENTLHEQLLERKTGDLIHGALQTLVELKTNPLHDTNIQFFRQLWTRQLAPVCSGKINIQLAIDKIERDLHNCLDHPEADWLFGMEHEDSTAELKLSDYRGGFRKEYIIDRSFVDKDNTRWIIDYKSSEPGEGQTKEEFLTEQKHKYRPQLDRYAELFQNLEKRPCRKALFMTAISCLVEL